MLRIIYSSSATAPFSEQQLDELLQTSRRNNLAADITGMLLYKEGNFMQTLEGPELAVQTLVEKIRSDPRHSNFTALMETPILERSFGNWSMGFKRITQETSINVPGYHDSDDFSLISSRFVQHPLRSLELLLSFK
jgi:lipopolysaccharide biosynthesis regulator YciM